MGHSPLSRRDRDAGLDRVSTLTRWTVAVALAATGFFAGLASQTGRGSTSATAKARAAQARARRRSSVVRTGDDGNTVSQPVLNPQPYSQPYSQPPAVLPAPQSSAFAPIVSGAS